MGSDGGRRTVISSAIRWILLGLGIGALAAGWLPLYAPSVYPPLDAETQSRLRELHISLALTAALLILLQIILSVVLFLFGSAPSRRNWRAVMTVALRQFVYFAFVAMIATGVSGAVFRGEQIYFWGAPLPFWDAGDQSTSELLQNAHRIVAYVLAGSVAAYLLVAVVNLVSPPAASRGAALAPEPPPSSTSIAATIAEGLAHNFRLFGGAAFWLQLLLSVVSALLLGFSFVGHTVSPNGASFGDAIYWASGGLALLAIATLFGFKYMNTASRITASPERYLGHERRTAFWFMGLGGFISIIGVLISFAGVGLSVALLIGKTVSQPPGIAITDPQKIVRALDVFVLLVNFNLLFAHFIGFGVAAWLSIGALKARHQYVVATEAGE